VSILVDNGIRHSEQGKEVLVRLPQTRNAAVLAVINDAEPIPQEQLAHVFERFYRTDEARNSEGQHYGLGLAIAKAIAEAHRGTIEACCRENQVCFTVRLPKA